MEKKIDIQSSRVILVKDEIHKSINQIISLNHPKFGIKANFLLSKVNKKLYEMQTFSEPNRCWLIDQTIKTDGDLYILSPIDPLFIVLPHVKTQCSNKAIPLDQLLEGSEDIELKYLGEIVTSLDAIADLKGPSDLLAYKYNEEKTLIWLHKKIKKIINVLKERNLHTNNGAVSATFKVSHVENSSQEDYYSYIAYAFGIVSEYLTEELSDKLSKFLGICNDHTSDAKRKNCSDDMSVNKRPKLISATNSDTMQQDAFHTSEENRKIENSLPKPKISAKEKQKQKAAVGTKSIMSFFSAK